MKTLPVLLTLIPLLILTGCTSKTKTDNDTGSADTTGYIEQPRDKIMVNDTMPAMNPDTEHLHPHTKPH